MNTVDFYCFDVGNLKLKKRNTTSGECKETKLQEDLAVCYMVKGNISDIGSLFNYDYVYIGKEHIIEMLSPTSNELESFVETYPEYFEEDIDREDIKGITKITNIKTGEEKVYPEYNYIPKYTMPYASLCVDAAENIPYDGNIEGKITCNIERVKSDNINRYKFLALLRLLINKKNTFNFVHVEERKRYSNSKTLEFIDSEYEASVASCKAVAIQLNVLLGKEVFFISDNGTLHLESDLLKCFQYLPDTWKTQNKKSYKMHINKVCANLLTCLETTSKKQEYREAMKEAEKILF